MQVAIIKVATGYADGNGNWQQTRDQAQQFFLREALEIQAFMAKQGKTATLERINVDG